MCSASRRPVHDTATTRWAEAAIALLREHERLTGASLKKLMVATGAVARADADRAWRAAKKALDAHEHVALEQRTYTWTGPRDVRPAPAADEDLVPEADEELAPVPVGAQDEALVRQLEALTARCAELEERLAASDTRPLQLHGAKERQSTVDAKRALAELAMEVEELAAGEVGAQVLIHRVRSRVRREGLEPIDQAGMKTTFTFRRHKPVAGRIAEGDPVLVVRPGYVWSTSEGDLLISKALVMKEGPGEAPG